MSTQMIFCRVCGKPLHDSAPQCPHCGAAQSTGPSAAAAAGKSKVTAGVLALLLGGLGIHKFYLGAWGLGIVYLLLVWTFVPGIVAFVEAIRYFTLPQADFQRKAAQMNGPFAFLCEAPARNARQRPPQDSVRLPNPQQKVNTAMKVLAFRLAATLAPLALVTALLSACAGKPPGCDDPAVVTTLQGLVMDPALDALDLVKPFARDARSSYFVGKLFAKRNWRETDRPQIEALHQDALARYRDGISASLSGVTTDGYDSQARRHQCKATLKLQSKASGQIMESRGVVFTVQGTAKSGEFQVEAAGLDGFITLVSKDATGYVVNTIAKGIPREPEVGGPSSATAPSSARPGEEEHGD